MTVSRYLVGDVFDRLAQLEDGSVDLVLTSPPFLALRSYLPDDHPDKGREIGQEPTPAEFLDTLLALTAEWDRVLAPHGSLVVELGDSYSGSGGSGGDVKGDGKRTQTSKDTYASSDRRDGWPLAKSLCGIPELYAFSLSYGRNLLTGAESPAGMWRVRNLVRWCRPNPPVGALGDKFRPATSTMTVACKSRTRWFDLDAVRTPTDKEPGTKRVGNWLGSDSRVGGSDSGNPDKLRSTHNPAGAPPLDFWVVPPSAYKGSHYATWPPDLLVRPVLSMCPQHVCRTCGEPRRRVVERERVINGKVADECTPLYQPGRASNGGGDYASTGGASYGVKVNTLGWTDCGHEDYRRGVVLDPFAGSGTTLAVANGLGRDAVGIDLDERNADLARERCGMFLEVEQ